VKSQPPSASVASGPFSAASAGQAPALNPACPLADRIAAEIGAAGGWIGFERFMALALYTPGLGYYSRGDRQFGTLARDGSDFVTAPELSPLFGRALARQVAQALAASNTTEVWEFGAGSGALAAQLIGALGDQITRYTIVDLSGTLRERQHQTLAAAVPDHVHKIRWVDALPETIEGVVVGNEVLDAMPVALLAFDGTQWFERGVALATDGAFTYADRPTPLRPPVEATFVPGTQTELPRIASAFITTLAGALKRGAAFFIDYGFPEHEFYLPQRHGGTLMCHRGHQADGNPLADVGDKDLTAHVDFTSIALAAQDAGMDVLGYTSQARFLFNCGLLQDLEAADLRGRAMAQKLVTEHEMGELFKVIGLAVAGTPLDPIGFSAGDRSHTL
jgi:SAM-dependent MidA family methyltransferase